MDEDHAMNGASYFDRLVASAERIARHAHYPGKDQAVGHCLEDIDDLMLEERITAEQGERLRAVLLNALSHAA
jgi:hypothetical protein